MIDSDFAIQTALVHHQAGQLLQAEQIYRRILEAEPRNVQALHLLGVIASQTGRHEAAIKLISDAIELDANNAILHLNLGEAYREAGKLDLARASYVKASALDSRWPKPHFYLALAHAAQGELQAAEECCRRAILLDPNDAAAHYSLGNILKQRGDSEAAIASYQRAVDADSNFFEAILNLGSVLRECGRVVEARAYLHRAIQLQPRVAEGFYFLANLEGSCGNWALAIEYYRRALALNPKMVAAEARLATALQTQGILEEAVVHYRRAIELQPDFGEAYYNLGTALAEQGHMPEAAEQYELAIQHNPGFISAHINLAGFYQDNGQEDRALVHIDRALEIDPQAPEPRFNRALIFLRRGELAAGWGDFQARLRLKGFPVQARTEPLWDGSQILGKTLLAHWEQGLGDTLHFIRYAPLAKERCARVVLQVQTALVPLLRQAGLEEIFGDDDPLPPCDVQAPLMSLPGMLGTTLANIPAEVPYLSVPDTVIARWQERLATLGGLRVGIAWQGSPTHISDRARSIPLAEFEPLARIAGVTLVNLQKHDGVEQLDEVKFAVHRLEGDWDETAGPFVDTAGVMKNLDLVITADTAIAHLAGAMGVNVWVALDVHCDWRWMRDREDTPWYPTMRLFRQAQKGNWTDVFGRIAAQLQRYRCPK